MDVTSDCVCKVCYKSSLLLGVIIMIWLTSGSQQQIKYWRLHCTYIHQLLIIIHMRIRTKKNIQEVRVYFYERDLIMT